jgi:hypothetical protein
LAVLGRCQIGNRIFVQQHEYLFFGSLSYLSKNGAQILSVRKILIERLFECGGQGIGHLERAVNL